MSTRLTHGTLTISVDLEHDNIHVGLTEQRALDKVVAQLIELVAHHKLPVTFGVADPAESAARSRVGSGGHEWAVLGDGSWVGREAGRGRFARELGRRVARARSEGLTVRSLALRTELPVDHADLAIKEGIVALRRPVHGSPGRTSRLQPQPVRFGLWGFPVTTNLPGTSRWLPGGGGTRAGRFEIDKAIAEQRLAHLAIDASRLAARGPASLRVVERILEHAARRRDSKLIQLKTIGAIAQHLGQENQGQPSRSILRPAA